MNRTSPDSERPPASEPVWERPWSVEEIRRSSQNWSLAADAATTVSTGILTADYLQDS
uniref:WASH complex subunit 2 n=1 Tax=Mus musculus TaxID=10090 RepID=A0A0N4SVI5_MOUSE